MAACSAPGIPSRPHEVLNVTKFLPDHPGGELAILTFAGKDATAEFNMIHPPDVIGKSSPSPPSSISTVTVFRASTFLLRKLTDLKS